MRESVTINVYTAGMRVGGRWADVAPATAACTASVQVASGESKQMIPELYRTSEAIEVFALSELRPLKRADGIRPTEVVWRDKRFSVEVLEDWSENALYWYAVCSSVEQ